MLHKQKEITQENNLIYLISTKRIITHKNQSTIKERKMPINIAEQTWIIDVEEKARVKRTIPKFVNTLVNILKWINHLGNGKIDDNHLGSGQNISQNFRIKSIGL